MLRPHAVLAPVSQRYPPLRDRFLRVTHPFATRTPSEEGAPVRLACLRYAASVCPEPGSNSPSYPAGSLVRSMPVFLFGISLFDCKGAKDAETDDSSPLHVLSLPTSPSSCQCLRCLFGSFSLGSPATNFAVRDAVGGGFTGRCMESLSKCFALMQGAATISDVLANALLGLLCAASERGVFDVLMASCSRHGMKRRVKTPSVTFGSCRGSDTGPSCPNGSSFDALRRAPWVRHQHRKAACAGSEQRENREASRCCPGAVRAMRVSRSTVAHG